MGTSENRAETLGKTSGMIWGQTGGENLAVSGDQIVGQALYGDSYRAPQIDDRLLRYHNDAPALGNVLVDQTLAQPFIMAGEVIKG